MLTVYFEVIIKKNNWSEKIEDYFLCVKQKCLMNFTQSSINV